MMTDLTIQWLISAIPHILAGAGVGVIVGLTGVGGGSLMTPILIGFGYNPAVAIGTDLLYASVTKAGGVYFHHKAGHIHWKIVAALSCGSLPSALLTVILLSHFFTESADYTTLLTTSLGVMLILTAAALLFKRYCSLPTSLAWIHQGAQRNVFFWTFMLGIPLGCLVTLSSVGAGALGTALLLALYPKLLGSHVVGTDIAHAVPLTLIAGVGHFLLLNTVDWQLLAGLLIGSLPGIAVGTRLNQRVSNDLMLLLLSFCLMAIGIRYTLF